MTAFLKIDTCRRCQRAIPWEWSPAIFLNGKAMAGTGTWRSQLVDHLCPPCQEARDKERAREHFIFRRRKELIELLGGEKPFREFTFETYRIASGNELAYRRCRDFNSAAENFYLWGACGVGKTHLAYAAVRRCFEESLAVLIQPAGQLPRKVRMKDPLQEQASIDQFAAAEVLLLDDLGTGSDTPYSRQLHQEILDRRDFADRTGLIITSRYSLGALARKFDDDTIPSRVAGMCSVIQIAGIDGRTRTARSP